MPACAACSGASEVGVIPGWVLVSSRISPSQPARLVPAEIGAADAPAAERADARAAHSRGRPAAISPGIFAGTTWRDPPGVYFASIVVPAVGDDVGHRQRPVAHHRDRQFAPRHIGLDHHRLGHVVGELRRARSPPRARCRRRPTSLRCSASPRRAAASTCRASHLVPRRRARSPTTGRPAAAIDVLGARLVHRQRRGEHAGMRVGNAQPFEHALDAAVLAPAAVQRVEGDVGLRRRPDATRGRGRRRPRPPRYPAARNAAAHSRPETSDTSRSAERPPISTATAGACPARHARLISPPHRPLSALVRGRLTPAGSPDPHDFPL